MSDMQFFKAPLRSVKTKKTELWVNNRCVRIRFAGSMRRQRKWWEQARGLSRENSQQPQWNSSRLRRELSRLANEEDGLPRRNKANNLGIGIG